MPAAACALASKQRPGAYPGSRVSWNAPCPPRGCARRCFRRLGAGADRVASARPCGGHLWSTRCCRWDADLPGCRVADVRGQPTTGMGRSLRVRDGLHRLLRVAARGRALVRGWGANRRRHLVAETAAGAFAAAPSSHPVEPLCLSADCCSCLRLSHKSVHDPVRRLVVGSHVSEGTQDVAAVGRGLRRPALLGGHVPPLRAQRGCTYLCDSLASKRHHGWAPTWEVGAIRVLPRSGARNLISGEAF